MSFQQLLPQIIAIRTSHLQTIKHKLLPAKKQTLYLQENCSKTSTWSVAEERRRDIEDQFRAADPTKPIEAIAIQNNSRKTIGRAIEVFLSDKQTQGLDPTAHKKHERELGRLKAFMENRERFFPREIGLDDLKEFRATWVKHYSSSLTRSKVQERLRGFLKYCFNAKMIDRLCGKIVIPSSYFSPSKLCELNHCSHQSTKAISSFPFSF